MSAGFGHHPGIAPTTLAQAMPDVLVDWYAFRTLSASTSLTVEWLAISDSNRTVAKFRPAHVVAARLPDGGGPVALWPPQRQQKSVSVFALEDGEVGNNADENEVVEDEAVSDDDLVGPDDVGDVDDEDSSQVDGNEEPPLPLNCMGIVVFVHYSSVRLRVELGLSFE